MEAKVRTAYDEVLYPNYCYPQTEPDHLASLAKLFGMKPAAPNHCRVLEVACGDGSNLLPYAFNLPDSRFLGIDLATQPIQRGQEMIDELGLSNIRLQVADFFDLPNGFEQFDYIVAHGLYSWVPVEVQERILELTRSCLSPHGVAYISYNVFPGCHLRRIVRGMMQYHTRAISNPQEKVSQARGLIKWIAEGQRQSNSYSLMLRDLNAAVAKRDPGAIFHDDLSEVNIPYYFHEFVTQAARHGLKFLSEAEYFYIPEENFPPQVLAQLKTMEKEDLIGKEQYQDFLEGRSFRETLLCHHEVALDRSFTPSKIREFYLRALTVPAAGQPDLSKESVEEFSGPKESRISTNFPLAKAALIILGEVFPKAVRFDELFELAKNRVGILGDAPSYNPDSAHDEENARALAELLLKAFGAGVIELRLSEPTFAPTPSERPEISPLARVQNKRGPILTSLLYKVVKFEDELARYLIAMLDGTRDRNTLLDELVSAAQETIESSGNSVSKAEREKMLAEIPGQLDEKLEELARLGFFIR